jgi:hypothetical protein
MSNKMTKVAGQVPGVLHEAAQHMRKLAEANVGLAEENDGLRHELRTMKLARRMEVRGIEPALDFESKVAKIAQLPVTKLAAVEEAVELTAGGFRLGHVEQPQTGEKRASSGELYSAGDSGDVLEGFVETMSAYS